MNKVFIALLAGIAAGILLAPDKGSRTRQKLSDGFDDLSDKLDDLAEKFTPEKEVALTPTSLPKMSAIV